MKVTIARTKQLSDGVWIGEMSEGDLQLIPGRAPEGGGKNVVVISNPEFSADGNLCFPLIDARLANRAANQATIFLQQTPAAIAPQDGSEKKEGHRRAAKLFWVSIATQAQKNLEIGLQGKVWGVENKFKPRLDIVAQGDFILFYSKGSGFTLCRIESAPFEDATPMLFPSNYPHRVKISAPILMEKKISYADLSGCLLDRHGMRYMTPLAANRGISGYGGTFRYLSPTEAQQIFSRLGWRYDVMTNAS